MGFVISTSQLTGDLLKKSTMPVILCSFSDRNAELVKKLQYRNINMNVKLAEALLRFPHSQRSGRANDEVMRIVSQFRTPVYLTDYEILFDPRYDLDVLKVFCEISRRQKVVVKWCGTCDDGDNLEYATPEYQDYHSFRIADYDIICVYLEGNKACHVFTGRSS